MAYADFVTAMMAFFLLMWLLNATTEDQRKGLADYFSPNSVLSHNSSGTGQPFGGRTAFSEGAMLSDLGSPQVTVGEQPVVDHVEEEDDSRVIAQTRPHRDDIHSRDPDLLVAATCSASRARPNCRQNSNGARNKGSNRPRSKFVKRWPATRSWPSWPASWRST